MVCQMCKREMPFKLRGSEDYYFEAVQVADDLGREDHAFYLALCPLCAAKYKVLVKKGSRDALNQFLDELLASDVPEVEIDLGEERASLRFVETHFLDLRTALQEVRSEGDEEAVEHE